MKRYEHNPVLSPTRERAWEAFAVFNPNVIRKDRKYYMLYRAISSSDLLKKQGSSFSSIGIAESKNGVNFSNRQRLVFPEEEWERFGCEDPRITFIDGKYYIFYTAISTLPPRAEGIRVGVAISRNLRRIEEKHLVTPFNAKAMALFPKRIKGKLTAVLTVNTDSPPAYIGIAQLSDDPVLWYSQMEEWYRNLKEHVLTPDPRRHLLDHIEVGAPPVRVKEGWLLIYSYIQNYFSQDMGSRVFGVEALILDPDDPRKVVAKTEYPFMVAQEFYEWYGHVPRVVFPTSAVLEEGRVKIYYGAADTTCCLATASLRELMVFMRAKTLPVFKRYPQKPIIKPIPAHDWESLATFNPAAIELEGKIYILYRALSADKTSTIGLAVTKDGLNIAERLNKPIYVPREEFENKLVPGHSGCEDPRIIKMGSRIYMFYTAYDNVNPPRVALTYINMDDFLAYEWNWATPRIISPPGIDDKNACIIPERIGSKYMFIHRTGGINIVYDYIQDLDSIDPNRLLSFKLIRPRTGMWDGKKVGLAAPPIKTRSGWLLFYHGVSADNVYRVGAALLDKGRPENVVARTLGYLLEPQTSYEKEGYVRNVVFPCGAIVREDEIYLYYGAADTYVCVATAPLKKLLSLLTAK